MIMNDDYFLELQNTGVKLPRCATIYGGTTHIQAAIATELARQHGAVDFVRDAKDIEHIHDLMGFATTVDSGTTVLTDPSVLTDSQRRCLIGMCNAESPARLIFMATGLNKDETHHPYSLRIKKIYEDLVITTCPISLDDLYFVRRRKPASIGGVSMLKATARNTDTDWQGTRRQGDVIYVHPEPLPLPHAAGQYKRVDRNINMSYNERDWYIEPLTPEDFIFLSNTSTDNKES